MLASAERINQSNGCVGERTEEINQINTLRRPFAREDRVDGPLRRQSAWAIARNDGSDGCSDMRMIGHIVLLTEWSDGGS